MNLFSGSQFGSTAHVIVGRRVGANGYLSLDGVGTSADISSMLYIGGWADNDAAANGYVTVTDRASLTATSITIGRTNGSVSSMTVNNALVSTKKAGSFYWEGNGFSNGAHVNDDSCGNLLVGASGRGILNVQQGGVVTVVNHLYSGLNQTSQENQIAMSGNGLLLIQGGVASIQNTTISLADSSRIVIANDVTEKNAPANLGFHVGVGVGDSATVNANGTNTISGAVYIGNSASGKLDVQSGATTIRSTDINLGNTSTTGEIVVQQGAKLSIIGTSSNSNSWVRVGANNSESSLTVYGTYVLGDDSFTGFSGTVLGRFANSTGTLLVSGENARFESLVNSGNNDSVGLCVGGYDGGNASTNAKGFATVEKGATMQISSLNIGNYLSAEGRMTVDDSTLSVRYPTGTSRFGYALIGHKGAGTLILQNSATMEVDSNLTIGNQATGSLSVLGGSVVTVKGETALGNSASGNGTFTLESGTVQMNRVQVGSQGAGSVLLSSGIWNTQEVNVANSSATSAGSITIRDGAVWNVRSADYVRIGRMGIGTLAIHEGGIYSAPHTHLIIGRNVRGELDVNGGSLTAKTLYIAGWEDSHNAVGIANIHAGGIVNASGLNLANSVQSQGTMNLGTAANDERRPAVTFTGANGVETSEGSSAGWVTYQDYAGIIGAEGLGMLNVYNADVDFQKSLQIGHRAKQHTGIGTLNLFDEANVQVTGRIEILSGSSLHFHLTEMADSSNVPLLTVSEGISMEDGATITISSYLSSIGQSLATDRRLVMTVPEGNAPLEIIVSDSWESWVREGEHIYATLETYTRSASAGAIKTLRSVDSEASEYALSLNYFGLEGIEEAFIQALQDSLQETDENALVEIMEGNLLTISNLDFNEDGYGIFAWNLTEFNEAHGTNAFFAQVPEPASGMLLLWGLGLGWLIVRRKR